MWPGAQERLDVSGQRAKVQGDGGGGGAGEVRAVTWRPGPALRGQVHRRGGRSEVTGAQGPLVAGQAGSGAGGWERGGKGVSVEHVQREVTGGRRLCWGGDTGCVLTVAAEGSGVRPCVCGLSAQLQRQEGFRCGTREEGQEGSGGHGGCLLDPCTPTSSPAYAAPRVLLGSLRGESCPGLLCPRLAATGS